MDRGAWRAPIHGIERVRHNLAPSFFISFLPYINMNQSQVHTCPPPLLTVPSTTHLSEPQFLQLGMCMLSCFSCVPLFATLWSVALQAPLSMGFSRQEYWGVLPYPPPGDLSNPGIKATSLTSHALAARFLTTSATWEAHISQ